MSRTLEAQARKLTPEEDKIARSSFDCLMAMANNKQLSEVKAHRGYVDGCFDLCHVGHFNAIRQAAGTVDTLIVGPNSDEEIERNKGPTILNG